MNRVRDFDQWWESKFGFQKLGEPFYPFLKQVHALGGAPQFVLKLAVLFSHIERPVREVRQSKKKRIRGREGVPYDMLLEVCEPALKEVAMNVFIGTLGRIKEIYSLWTKPPLTLPSKEFLEVLEIGAEIRDEQVRKLIDTAAERMKAKPQEEEQKLADDVKARPFGEIIYEYAFTDLRRGRGNSSELWATFCLTVLSEHFRERTPEKKPHFSMGAWLITGKRSKHPARDTKRIGERVRQFKRFHPNWAQQVQRVKKSLRAANGMILP